MADEKDEWVDDPVQDEWVDDKPEDSLTFLQALGKGVKNIPSNIASLGSGMFTAITSPKQTLDAIGDIAEGTINNIFGITGSNYAPLADKPVKIDSKKQSEIERKNALSRDLIKDITTSFGLQGGEAFKKKLSERPIDIAMDVGSVVAPALKSAGLSKTARAVDIATNPIQLGGAIAKPVVKKILSPFSKEAMTDVIKLADKYEVELPAASLTESRKVPIIEARASKSAYGQNVVDTINNANIKIKQIAGDIVEKAGKETDVLAIGETIDKGLDGFRETYYNMKDDLYKKADISNINTKIDMTNATKAIDDILATKGKSLIKDAPVIKQLRDLKQALTKQVPISGARATFLDIKNKISWGRDTVSSGDNAVWKKIAEEMDKDISVGLEKVRPDIADNLAEANRYFKDNINLLNSKWGKAIYLNSGKPDLIVKSILKKDMSSLDIPKFFEAIGSDATDSIRVATLKDAFSDAISPVTGNLSASKMAGYMKRNGDRLKAILTPEQYKSVEDVAELSKALARGDKIAHGSQTAFLQQSTIPALLGITGGTLGGYSGASVGVVVSIIGQNAWNKFISSPRGRQWLTTGFKIPGKAGEFRDILAKVAIAAKQKEITGGK